MKTTRLGPVIVLLAVAVSLAQRARAQITYDGCTDMRGLPVASVLDPSINDIAMAMLAPNGAPIIRYNPRVVAMSSPETRLFFYAHECGHHALGHTLGTTHPLLMEQNADCWAARTLTERGLLDERGLAVVQNDIARFSPGDWTHLPGPQRAVNLGRCLRSGRTERSERVRPRRQETAARRCCDGFGRPWCALQAPIPVGAPCFCYGVPGSGNGCP
ncbi:MAG TPA: hypothetical protein VKF32_03330 [Thermoanaerobaculia bacterium]|nr:hypothetical protein [Thermoanaerobaculia bacterium]